MNLALFDFDGTITRGDTWTPFLRYSATRPRIAAAVLLSPLIVAYKAGWISARR
jgi:phosphatidylglycerophosphatase C